MKRKIVAWACLLAVAFAVVGCAKKETAEQTTTLTGMVVSVEGTVVNLMEIGAVSGGQGNWGGQRPSGGTQMPEGGFNMPEGDFTMPEGGFNPEDFYGQMPEGGFTMPEGMEGFTRPEGDFTMPEGGFNPEDFNGQMPEGMTRPEGGSRPEGGRPESGNGEAVQMQTTAVDLKNAHISIQDGDIKAAGSISDIKPGSMLTITLNSKGEATEVLVTSTSRFGGVFDGNMPNFSGRGPGGSMGSKDQT